MRNDPMRDHTTRYEDPMRGHPICGQPMRDDPMRDDPMGVHPIEGPKCGSDAWAPGGWGSDV
jgi:hypothetical protein